LGCGGGAAGAVYATQRTVETKSFFEIFGASSSSRTSTHGGYNADPDPWIYFGSERSTGVPEPASLSLFALGGLLLRRNRRR
jgi:hypothetical protein